AESVPRRAQRLYQFLDPQWLNPKLYRRLVEAEEAIYQAASDPMVNWDVEDLHSAFEQAGFAVEIEVERVKTQVHVTGALLQRWFPPPPKPDTSYAARLAQKLTAAEVESVKKTFFRYLDKHTVSWSSTVVFLVN
ncbi:MAG: hypothetical protein ACRDEA_22395, partial [Microcystaceae cyanobacterium]